MAVVFRDNIGPYTGLGRKLTKSELDGNFYDVLTRIIALESGGAFGLDSLEYDGAHITFHWSDDTSSGPIRLPVATFRARGAWTNDMALLYLDVVTVTGVGSFLVLEPHTTPSSPEEFDPDADNDSGDPLYLMIAESADMTDVMKFRGDFATGTAYFADDVFTSDLYGLFAVVLPHSGPVTFDPFLEEDSVPVYKQLAGPPFSPVRDITDDEVTDGIYVLTIVDLGQYLRFPFGCIVQVPEIPDWPVSGEVHLRQNGDEDVIPQAEDELVVTLNPQRQGYGVGTPYKGAVLTLKCVATNVFDIIGPHGDEVSS